MSKWNPFKRHRPTNKKPTVAVGPTFTQGHRLTISFILQLLETLRDKQHDYYVDDVLELHIGHLTDIYVHLVTHLKQSSDTPKKD